MLRASASQLGMIMPLIDENADPREAQPLLDLSLPQIRSGGRIWLIALEPRDHVREIGPGHSPFRGTGRHVFFDPLTGAPAFAPSDLLLFREPDGRGFRLLIPDHVGLTAVTEKRIADRVEVLVSGAMLSGARGHSVRNIGCLSFGPTSFNAELLPTTRTRLERALARLGPIASIHPRVALHECRTAEQLLGGHSHRAIDAYVNEVQAIVLEALERETGSEDYRARAISHFDQAARNFDRAGLAFIGRRAILASSRLTDLFQPEIPGLLEGRAGAGVEDVFAPGMLNPVMGFAIDIPEKLLAGAPANTLGIARYRSVRRLQLDDHDLCRMVNPLTSPSRRVVATVKPTRSGVTIRAGHADAMRALLRLSSARPSSSGLAGIDFESATLDFDREWARAQPGRTVRVQAIAKTVGPHDVAIRCHMATGEAASLLFRIPEKVGAELVYS